MLTAFQIKDEQLTRISISEDTRWFDKAIWVELIRPTMEEKKMIEELCGIDIPDVRQTEELEASSNYEVYPNGFQINCLFLQKETDQFRTVNVAFIVTNDKLISLSAMEVATPNRFKDRWRSQPYPIVNPLGIIVAILDQKIEWLADMSEMAYQSIDRVSHQIFERKDTELEDTIDQLSTEDDLNGKIRLSLMDAQRDINFILRRKTLVEATERQANEIMEDIRNLLNHNSFLSERIDFLLNAALGFINIQQNKIIKIFSIVAVVMMPPTVIASIYGMNFHFIPELSWRWGYPVSLVLMALAAISPYLFFKKKGWL